MLLPRLMGHRGFAARAPENTLSALRAAAEAGIRWVEIDVQLLADGTPVIWHDAHMARCSNSRAFLSQVGLAEARRFDVGSWFSPEFAGERIATLEEALATVDELGLGLNLEIKVSTARDPLRLTEAVVPLLNGALPSDRLLLSSFSQEALYRAHRLDPSLNLGILYDEKVPRVWQWDVERVGAVSIHANWENLNPNIVKEMRQKGLEVVCYTVNDPEAFSPWWECGVNSVISDDPTLFSQLSDAAEYPQGEDNEHQPSDPIAD